MLIIGLLSLLCVACDRQDGPSETMVIPLSICLPANETQAMHGGPARRIMGDPGATEQFLLPNYLYIIILRQDGDNWVLWRSIEREVTAGDWQKKRYTGPWQTPGDSIYQLTEQMRFMLINQYFNGRVYAVASAVPLTFNRTLNSIASLSDAENLTFSTSDATIQQNLQHIYSTPCNYTVNDAYYGSFSSLTTHMSEVNLVLYHVAAKVDIQWNVVDSMRIRNNPYDAVRLTYMEAQHLFSGDAYCFKPMRNELAAKVSTGYAIADMVTPSDEGLWWEGRTYFYTIPYSVTGNADYFPLQMLLRTNGSAGTGYRPTIDMRIDTSDVFVPWMRVHFNLTKPLEDKTETITAG